jgi:hypothetical protein
MTEWKADKNRVVDALGNVICIARYVPPQNGMPACTAEYMARMIASAVSEFFFNHYVVIKEENDATMDDTGPCGDVV